MVESNRVKNFRLYPFAALILILLVWGTAFRSFFIRIGEVRDKIVLRTKELSYQKGILEQEDVFAKRYEQVREIVNPSAGGPDERLSAFIDQVEKWAKEEKLIVHDVRPLPSDKENRVTLLRVVFELEGEMKALNRFLYKAVASREPLQIDRMSFVQKARMKSEINLDIELSFLYLE